MLGFEEATVCLKTVMDQCYTDITDEQEILLFQHAPEVIQRIRTDGCVTDLFLDSIGVPKLQGKLHVDRDGLVPWRRHAYLMSHTYSKADFIDYLKIKNDNNNPVLQQQKKDREQALKIVRKAEILKDREDLAAREKAAKVAEKTEEKARRDALTLTERKAEDQMKKLQNSVIKAAKLQAAAEQLAQAMIVIG